VATVHYPAIIERGAHGFGVYFPDLPGCVSAGRTVQEAAIAAEEALNGHLATMAEFGDEIPEPSDIDAITTEEGSDEVARILVRGETASKAVRVQISMEEGLLARIDRAADNRSRFLSDAARAQLANMVAGGIIGQGELATKNFRDLERIYGLKPVAQEQGSQR
jgi:predicted RNase H-like HicB family nuclease